MREFLIDFFSALKASEMRRANDLYAKYYRLNESHVRMNKLLLKIFARLEVYPTRTLVRRYNTIRTKNDYVNKRLKAIYSNEVNNLWIGVQRMDLLLLKLLPDARIENLKIDRINGRVTYDIL